ncbi:tetratricopeptide repeat protein [bacterium]|nr:tetratricopeptide repeat protein [bacterium]
MPRMQRMRLASLVLIMSCVPMTVLAVVTKPATEDSLGLADSVLQLDEPLHGVATSYMIGLTLFAQGDAAGALPYLAHAHRLSPDEEVFAKAFRDVLLQLGYLPDALGVSMQLVARPPVPYETWLQHVSIFVAMERYDEAFDALADFRQEHPDSLQLGMLQAEILLRSHRWDEALAIYRALLPVLPEEREHIYMAMAEMTVHLEKHDEATAIWAEGLAAMPDSRPLRLGSLQHHIFLGRDEAAVAIADDGDALAEGGPGTPATIWLRTAVGLIAAEGRVSEAIGVLEPRFDAGSLDLETSLLLGRLLARLESWPAAIDALDTTAQRWPESAMARMFLGEFMAESDDLAGGEQHVRRAIEMDATVPDFLLSLISILSRRHPDAFARGERLPADDPLRVEVVDLARRAQSQLDGDAQPANHMMIGATLQAMGEHAGSIVSYRHAAEEPRFRREALLNLSLAYERTDRGDEARDVLEELLQEYPDDPVVLNALGYTLADQDRELERAERLIRSALKQDPENPAYLDSLGWLHYRKGDHADALDYLVNAANALPEDPEILEHLGLVMLELGRHDRALEILKRALLLGGDAAAIRPVIEELEPVAP